MSFPFNIQSITFKNLSIICHFYSQFYVNLNGIQHALNMYYRTIMLGASVTSEKQTYTTS